MSAMAQNTFAPMMDTDLDWIVDTESELHASPWSRGNFSDALTSGYSAWVMRHDDEPAAYAVMLLVLDEAHLLNISVAKNMQQRGLGAICMDYLFKQARLCGATQFFLEVRPSNTAALALYRRHGFVVIGRRRRYYPAPGGEREDAQVMRLELSS